VFTVYFHHATTTPSQPGLGQLVEAALADNKAERTGLEAEIRLADGALFYLFGEDDDGLMLAEYPSLTSSVSDLLLAILRRTNGFLLDTPDALTFVRTVNSVGEPRGPLTFEIEIIEVESSEALSALLSSHANNENATTSPRSEPRRARQRGSSLMDVLFGKPG
jgi:hypothetical protein